MSKTYLISKANFLSRKGAWLAMILITAILSALSAVGLSVLINVNPDYMAALDRLNSVHLVAVMNRDDYLPSFRDILEQDARVSKVETADALLADNAKINYGGETTGSVIILSSDSGITISGPDIIDNNEAIPLENAVYLPSFAKGIGFKTGDEFSMVYRNRPLNCVVAGFFDSNELATPNSFVIKIFASPECFDRFSEIVSRQVWIGARCVDPYEAASVYNDFAGRLDIELSSTGEGSFGDNWIMFSEGVIMPVYVITAILIVFAFFIGMIILMVTRFRVTSAIDGAVHNIGVLKASGYTNAQITSCYLLEYGALTLPAAIAGAALTIPLFSVIRGILKEMTGTNWTMGINTPAAIISVLVITAIIILMVWRSCGRIRKLPPVDALRGGIAANNFRRNYFPLNKGTGGVGLRLGIKNIFAYGKTYIMIGVLITVITLTLTVLGSLYSAFVIDTTAFKSMMGIELAETQITVTRHTDADALAREIESLPQVRKTSMLDWVSLKVEGVSLLGFASNDYSQMENMRTYEGRFPMYDNEIAIPSLLADQLGKKMGDTIKVEAAGIELDCVISGFFSVASNGGRIGAMTLEGYRRHDPEYLRTGINVYLNEGVPPEAFIEILKENYGILNVYKESPDGEYAAAKARAEEKISNYMEYFGIDNVEYAVMKDGEVILEGSSDDYMIERVDNMQDLLETQIGMYASTVSTVTQAITAVSMVIVCLVLGITVRQIIIKRRRELGTLKANGYTSAQLARQLAVSFLPCGLIGTAAGCMAGVFLTAPAMTVMFASTGVKSANIPADLLLTVLFGAATLIIAFISAHISAMSVKNISVYELLSE